MSYEMIATDVCHDDADADDRSTGVRRDRAVASDAALLLWGKAALISDLPPP